MNDASSDLFVEPISDEAAYVLYRTLHQFAAAFENKHDAQIQRHLALLLKEEIRLDSSGREFPF